MSESKTEMDAMTSPCPNCGSLQKENATYCDQCSKELCFDGPDMIVGGRGVSSDPAKPSTAGAPREAVSHTESAIAPVVGTEIVVEVETNRRHVLRHASLLRFRVTNNMTQSCGVTVRMRLHGQGRYVEQDEEEMEQCCQFEERGNQCEFSFPFQSLMAGQIRVNELRILITRAGQLDKALVYELPDQSLFIDVADPAMASSESGVEISGGIHIDFSQLQEMYGADIKSLLNLSQGSERQKAGVAWQPIRLRVVGEKALSVKEIMPRELQLALPGRISLDLVRIAAGDFLMGSPAGQGRDDERPQRRVTITRPIYLGKFPVTQEQYQALMNRNPSRFSLSPRHPVDNVSWEDAQEFCQRLHAHLGQAPDALDQCGLVVDAVSLPTEAEWEYACRAGTETLWSFGNVRDEIGHFGWYEKNSSKTTHAVGLLRPNDWGLYDMHGNVLEWCADYHAPTYDGAAQRDPSGPAIGERRVLRGGSWSGLANDCRSARRHTAPPDERTANYGFRVVVRSSIRTS